MRFLRQALKEANMTQAQLARNIGVSDVAVNQWVNGKHKVPDKRIAQIEDVLGVDLRAHVVDYETITEHGRTPVGWAILWPVRCPLEGFDSVPTVPRSAEDYQRRVLLWSRLLDATKSELEQAILGQGLLTMGDAQRIAEHCGMRTNAVIFSDQVGYRQSEADAVQDALGFCINEGVQTFSKAHQRLTQARADFNEEGLQADPGRAQGDLDDGEAIPDIKWWLEGGAAPEGFKGQGVGQDLTGRFKSR